MKTTAKLFWIILVILIVILFIAAYKTYQKNKIIEAPETSPVNPVGLTAYANKSNVSVYNSSSLSNLYKTAAKDEWIGTVLAVEGDLYRTSGNRYVYISDTYLQ